MHCQGGDRAIPVCPRRPSTTAHPHPVPPCCACLQLRARGLRHALGRVDRRRVPPRRPWRRRHRPLCWPRAVHVGGWSADRVADAPPRHAWRPTRPDRPPAAPTSLRRAPIKAPTKTRFATTHPLGTAGKRCAGLDHVLQAQVALCVLWELATRSPVLADARLRNTFTSVGGGVIFLETIIGAPLMRLALHRAGETFVDKLGKACILGAEGAPPVITLKLIDWEVRAGRIPRALARCYGRCAMRRRCRR